MDATLRNILRNTVTRCRKLLEGSISEKLEGDFGIHADGTIEDAARLSHLSPEEQEYRERIVVHLKHIQAAGLKSKESVAQLVREAAFTHLNRLCAYKMMAARKLIDDPVGKVFNSRGFIFFLAEHKDAEDLFRGGEQARAYRRYFEWLNAKLSEEIGVLFAPDDLASGLFPPHGKLEEVLQQLNGDELKDVWREDETIGWVYQYFTPDEMRRQARRESAAPRNSYELAFRNQFFTPRYVVEFLTDNTLGRTWYEMRKGETRLVEACRYLVRRPNELFLAEGESAPEEKPEADGDGETSSAAAWEQSAYIPHRAKKDPREIKVLDPASGSGHFLLYCFDLLTAIYEEAYEDAELGAELKREFPNEEDYKQSIPALILENNLHGIDIDLRVTQLAALALWMRAQRAYQEMNLRREARPAIKRINVVCAEPMPGEGELLDEFVAALQPKVLGDVVRDVFEKMRLAGETGGLLRIEDDISEKLAEARKDWVEMRRRQAELKEEHASTLFEYKAESPQAALAFDVSDITDEEFWQEAEVRVVEALREYAARASNGRGLLRRLFADDAEQGFAFVDLCRKKFDVVLMNPPLGDASIPSKPYIDGTYGDTKGDVYKAFVECFQDRLVPGGYLGIISSRTGFFLSQSADWCERVVLRLYRPLLLADFGMGVLDAMVETAAYVLRSLTEKEDEQLTLSLVPEIERVPKGKNDVFSTKKYADMRELKRHQANGELRRLHEGGFIEPVEGSFPRWKMTRAATAQRRSVYALAFPPFVCLRLLGESDKESALREVLANAHDTRRFVASPAEFSLVPNTPFAYWVSNRERQLFKELSPLESEGRTGKQGLATADDFRFVRLWWETSPKKVVAGTSDTKPEHFHQQMIKGMRWVPFAKGGAYSPYYADLYLVVNWQEDGKEIKGNLNAAGKIRSNVWMLRDTSLNYFFRPGLTWSLRTDRLSVRVLPAGTIFSHKGPAVFIKQNTHTELMALASVMNSQAFSSLIQMLVARVSLAQSFEVGLILSVPTPNVVTVNRDCLCEIAFTNLRQKRALDSANEISHVFQLPAFLQAHGATLAERGAAWAERVTDADSQLAANQAEIDRIAFRLYGIDESEVVTRQPSIVSEEANDTDMGDEDTDEEETEQPVTDHRPLTADLLSYALGCAMGRWDIRYATGAQHFPSLPDPFAPLPVCAPAALTGEDNLPLTTAPEAYPLEADWDGILTDDEHHPDDIITRVRRVLDLIFGDSSEAREQEACQLLGVRHLRDYFRKATADGFWQHHIKRHSKSRRKAPIYWLLQSSKKNYVLWIYYHRLTRDTLYKALINYVEPKLRLETNNLDALRAERQASTATGREARQLEKAFDTQESFISELNDFRDKLKRAADLGLDFDLNDGVVLNIAPLWELVPWTEAKKYWTELTGGKYEWSSISQQLRAKGLVK